MYHIVKKKYPYFVQWLLNHANSSLEQSSFVGLTSNFGVIFILLLYKADTLFLFFYSWSMSVLGYLTINSWLSLKGIHFTNPFQVFKISLVNIITG